MLPNLLNTNEIKGSNGVEIEFTRLSSANLSTLFGCPTVAPSTPNVLSIKHTETGSGLSRVRRSVVRFDLDHFGSVDTTKMCRSSFYTVGVLPIGNLGDLVAPKVCLAELMSFLATTGVATTVLFDGTGNGAQCLLNGTI